MQFIRRCDKVAIVDHGKIHYFGPFNATAQSILASYLPVPDEDTAGAAAGKDARPKPAKKETALALAKPPAKPRTALPMGAAFRSYIGAGPAWKFIVSVSAGLVSQASRQMSDFWIRAWADDDYGHYAAQDDPQESGGRASQIYAGLYGAFTFAFWFIQVRSSVCVFHRVA